MTSDKKYNILGLMLFTAFLLLGCGGSQKQVEEFISLNEQVGEWNFTSIKVQQFDSLQPDEKILAYYLSQAAICGTPIVYKQIHPDGYRIKSILDGIVSHTVGMNEQLLNPCIKYTKRYWANHGFYNRNTGMKFIPENIDRNRMQFATLVALSNGAEIGFTAHKVVQLTFDELEPVVFDRQFEAEYTGKRVEKWDEEFLVGIFRAGNDTLKPGACDEEFSRMVDNIRRSMEFAKSDEFNMLKNLAIYFETGIYDYYESYMDDWIKFKGDVDWCFGFFPSFHINNKTNVSTTFDSLFSGLVFIKDNASLNLINTITEKNWKKIIDEYAKKIETESIAVNVVPVQVLCAAGDAGFKIPYVIAISHNIDEVSYNKIFVLSNLFPGFSADAGLSQDSTIIANYIYKALRELVRGERYVEICDQRQRFITPIPEIEINKMGGIKRVILDYPESVLDYGIKIAEISRVAPKKEYDSSLIE